MRRAADPNHPLTRLRGTLSREKFAERVGIPARTIKEIETGKYNNKKKRGKYGMNALDIAKISIATGVHPESLAAGTDPLIDISGRSPLSPDSPKLEDWAETKVDKATLAFLVEVAVDAAAKKGASYMFQFLLQEWLCKTSKTFGLDELIRERLTAELGSFIPGIIPPYFLPQDEESKRLWKEFVVDELQKEQFSIYFKQVAHDPKKDARRQRFVLGIAEPKEAEFKKEIERDLWACVPDALERCKARRVDQDKSAQGSAGRPKQTRGKRSPSPGQTKVG